MSGTEQIPPDVAITDVRHYTGGGQCQYDCDRPADFVVQIEHSVAFIGCRECLVDGHIHPIDDEYLDEIDPYEQTRWA